MPCASWARAQQQMLPGTLAAVWVGGRVCTAALGRGGEFPLNSTKCTCRGNSSSHFKANDSCVQSHDGDSSLRSPRSAPRRPCGLGPRELRELPAQRAATPCAVGSLSGGRWVGLWVRGPSGARATLAPARRAPPPAEKVGPLGCGCCRGRCSHCPARLSCHWAPWPATSRGLVRLTSLS